MKKLGRQPLVLLILSAAAAGRRAGASPSQLGKAPARALPGGRWPGGPECGWPVPSSAGSLRGPHQSGTSPGSPEFCSRSHLCLRTFDTISSQLPRALGVLGRVCESGLGGLPFCKGIMNLSLGGFQQHLRSVRVPLKIKAG